MTRIIFSLSFMMLLCSGKAQDETDYQQYFSAADWLELERLEDTLGLLGHLVVNDTLADRRFAACKKFIKTLTRTLKIENSFHFPFKQLKTVSILKPEDQAFRIFTWQLYIDKDTYHYYGAIQMNSGELKLFPLLDRSHLVEDIQHQVLKKDEWYGALYYNIRAFDTPKGKHYLLFGFDANSFLHKRKILDVLSFVEGEPRFGAPVFVKELERGGVSTQNRILLEYSAEATVKLNYDVFLNMIVFDHLISMNSSLPGQGVTNYPDGSYEGYRYENGQWIYIDKVFTQVSETPPRERAILDKNKNKNIFGHR